ncbi:hypothetical protein J6590_020383 [Homalodisca vitripennis]|nr:hypothetical protein J6590_020383 [Homalodisca vitripennis]
MGRQGSPRHSKKPVATGQNILRLICLMSVFMVPLAKTRLQARDRASGPVCDGLKVGEVDSYFMGMMK